MRPTPLAAGAGLALLAWIALAPGASAQDGPGPVEVGVGLHLINFGNYDATKGSYVMDFYLVLRWDEAAAPGGFTPQGFEFMNRLAVAKELLSDESDNGTRELWYRVQATLYSEPRFEDYPYDRQELVLRMEDTTHPAAELVYVPIPELTALDPDVRVAGWRVDGQDVHAVAKEYPFAETYSRYTFQVEVSREPLSSTLRSFLPPVAFMVVSGFSFFFDRGKIAQRITLGTSMLISAVGFHISQTVSLPALGVLTLFDRVMISTYAFLAASLVVTTLIAYSDDHGGTPERARAVNRKGALWAVAGLAVTFAILLMV